MELLKETVRIAQTVYKGDAQIKTEGDIVVPDIKPDILKLLQVDAISSVTDTTISEGKLDIKNGDLIESSNKYAGGVQAFFEDGNRTQFTVKNTEMSMTYTRAASGDQLVSSIKVDVVITFSVKPAVAVTILNVEPGAVFCCVALL